MTHTSLPVALECGKRGRFGCKMERWLKPNAFKESIYQIDSRCWHKERRQRA